MNKDDLIYFTHTKQFYQFIILKKIDERGLLSIPIESDDDELLEAISKVHINNLLEEGLIISEGGFLKLTIDGMSSLNNHYIDYQISLINLSKNLGEFSYIFIAIAAFTTMFSTTITTLDASPRAMNRSSKLLFNKEFKLGYWFWIIFLFIGTFIILKFYYKSMGDLVKIATILSFLTAPFYAILNYVLITGKHTPKEHQPNIYLKILSIIGIIFLIGFSVWFLTSI